MPAQMKGKQGCRNHKTQGTSRPKYKDRNSGGRKMMIRKQRKREVIMNYRDKQRREVKENSCR